MTNQEQSPAHGKTPIESDQNGPQDSKSGSLPLFTHAGWKLAGILAVAAAVGLIAAAGLPVWMAGTAALTVLCIGLWATAVVPEYWTALAFFLVVVASGIAPPEVAFSGFQSSTFWLLFSGLVLGAAIRHTGLGQRAAALLSGMLGTRYAGVIVGIVLFGLALAFVMPSSLGRIVLLVPIIVALADRMGYGATSPGRTGMLMAAAFGTWLPAFAILPSNTPNMILAGMAETLYGERLSYGTYLLLHFPVLGALKAVVLVALILWMFPDRDPAHRAPSAHGATPMTGGERRLTAVLGLCLALWVTDGLHHISPGWIGLAAALYCLWPASKLTSAKCINEDISYGLLLFIAGIMGLGAVISATGLGAVVVEGLSGQAGLAVDQPAWNVAALAAISTVAAMVTNLPGVPAVMTPLAEDLAAMTGLPLATVLMTQVLAFSNAVLPYQAPPLVTAMQIAHLPIGAITRLCVAMFAITALVLTPLDLVWWHLLGVLESPPAAPLP